MLFEARVYSVFNQLEGNLPNIFEIEIRPFNAGPSPEDQFQIVFPGSDVDDEFVVFKINVLVFLFIDNHSRDLQTGIVDQNDTVVAFPKNTEKV